MRAKRSNKPIDIITHPLNCATNRHFIDSPRYDNRQPISQGRSANNRPNSLITTPNADSNKAAKIRSSSTWCAVGRKSMTKAPPRSLGRRLCVPKAASWIRYICSRTSVRIGPSGANLTHLRQLMHALRRQGTMDRAKPSFRYPTRHRSPAACVTTACRCSTGCATGACSFTPS
jgi:hypothetical protein